jgi:hypothetical protein
MLDEPPRQLFAKTLARPVAATKLVLVTRVA